MNKINIFFISIFILSVNSCRYVVNNFDEHSANDSYQIHRIINEDFFILRITESQVVKQGSDIYETPLRRFHQIASIDTSKTILEEVYIYLGDLSRGSKKGSAIYFVTYPFTEKTADILYNNGKYLSTYSIREILVGQWTIIDADGQNNGIKIELNKGNDKMIMVGTISPEKLSIEKASHPKLDVHSVYETNEAMVDISDIFFLGEEGRLIFSKNIAGRRFIHPDWSALDSKIDNKQLKDNHDLIFQKESITGIILGDNGNNIYRLPLIFSISSNESSVLDTLKFIEYNK